MELLLGEWSAPGGVQQIMELGCGGLCPLPCPSIQDWQWMPGATANKTTGYQSPKPPLLSIALYDLPLQVRNHIQRQKIDMAQEVIDAGRFDMSTTMDERKATLEAMLQVPLAHTRTLAHAHAHT